MLYLCSLLCMEEVDTCVILLGLSELALLGCAGLAGLLVLLLLSTLII